MRVEIITPDEILFEGDAKLVQLPGTGGSFELLNLHAPIISTLKNGTIRVVETSGETVQVAIASGVVEMQNNKVVILAEK